MVMNKFELGNFVSRGLRLTALQRSIRWNSYKPQPNTVSKIKKITVHHCHGLFLGLPMGRGVAQMKKTPVMLDEPDVVCFVGYVS